MEDAPNYSLPLDQVISILLKLPEKSLVRFMCVSKSWLTLITSERFIRLYLQANKPIQSQNSNGSNSFILVGRNTILTYDFSSAQIVYKLPSPPNLLTRHTFIGSTNGLICFLQPNGVSFTVTIALYNPTTQACKVLPTLERRGGGGIKYDFGFGYDYKNSDFKIVSLMDPDHPHIYRLRSNSWEHIKPRNFEFMEYEIDELISRGSSKSSVFSNNALHWQLSTSILGFNLATEEFYRVPLPEWSSWHENFWDLADLRGCLHLLITKNFDNRFFTNIGIWVMKKYGVQESWTKLLHYTSNEVIDLFISTSTIQYSSNFEPRLYAYSKDDQEILLSLDRYQKYFFSCHLQTREVKKVEALSNLLEVNDKEGFSGVPWICTFASCD